jgi:hypothetical protein
VSTPMSEWGDTARVLGCTNMLWSQNALACGSHGSIA